MIQPLPTPREGESDCEFIARLRPDERMRLQYRQAFRQLGAVLEAEVRSGRPIHLAGQFWEMIEESFAQHVMMGFRQVEAIAADRERDYWRAEVERLEDMLSAEHRMVLELQKRLETANV